MVPLSLQMCPSDHLHLAEDGTVGFMQARLLWLSLFAQNTYQGHRIRSADLHSVLFLTAGRTSCDWGNTDNNWSKMWRSFGPSEAFPPSQSGLPHRSVYCNKYGIVISKWGFGKFPNFWSWKRHCASVKKLLIDLKMKLALWYLLFLVPASPSDWFTFPVLAFHSFLPTLLGPSRCDYRFDCQLTKLIQKSVLVNIFDTNFSDLLSKRSQK